MEDQRCIPSDPLRSGLVNIRKDHERMEIDKSVSVVGTPFPSFGVFGGPGMGRVEQKMLVTYVFSIT
jgi:hypothetical protein